MVAAPDLGSGGETRVGSSPTGPTIKGIIMPTREGYDWLAYCKKYRIENPIPKADLIDGHYYVGYCRNARIARWFEAEQIFKHWRNKFGSSFIEEIQHPEDEDYYDVFIPVRLVDEHDLTELHGEIK